MGTRPLTRTVLVRGLLATATGFAALLTLVWTEWIELLFHVDPDGGSGALEWLVIGMLLAVSVTLGHDSRRQYRRTVAPAT